MEAQHKPPHERTFFHLVPINDKARSVLYDKRNLGFVSDYTPRFGPASRGLEVGYHNSQRVKAEHIATLGREGDLVINDDTVSRKHLTFEVLAQTVPAICLRVQRPSNQKSEVALLLPKRVGNDKVLIKVPIVEALILDYPKDYTLDIAGCLFSVRWCFPATFDDIKGKITEQYAQALQEARDYVPKSNKETIRPANARSHYLTRHKSGTAPPVKENAAYRAEIDSGSFGSVYSTADGATGEAIAVKCISLSSDNIEEDRAQAHAEIKLLHRCQHPHVIELLGYSDLSKEVNIYMPLCEGNLFSLSEQRERVVPLPYQQVLGQILSALDFLEMERICHRDVKPYNILYHVLDEDQGRYHFQLSDFGSASHVNTPSAGCGTYMYWAPEVSKGENPGFKADIWALYVSLVHIQQGSSWPGPSPISGEQVQKMVLTNDYFPEWRAMAREDPRERATAGQCLLEWFDGDGLSHPVSQIPKMAVPKGELPPPPPPPPRRSKRHGGCGADPSATDGHGHHPGVAAHDRRRDRQPVQRPTVNVAATAGPSADDDGHGAAAQGRRKRKQSGRDALAPVDAAEPRRKLARRRSPSPMRSIVWQHCTAERNAAAHHHPSTVSADEDVVMGGMDEDVFSVGGHNLRSRR